MRAASIAFLLTIVVVGPARSQASRGAPPPPDPTPIPRHVSRAPSADLPPIKLEDQWTTALTHRDAATFERLLAPRFVYTENASVMNRGEVIKSVNGPDRVEWARNEGMRLHDFGDVHVVTGVLHLRGRGSAGAFDRRYQFTDTWQRANGRWQIIAAQDYLIPR
jgi:ketosteroid isomerase-like protein